MSFTATMVSAAQVILPMPSGRNFRDKYSNRAENFKRPKNREDSSDLDENLTESIAAMRSIISKIFGAARAQKNCFQNLFRAICGLNIYRCPSSSPSPSPSPSPSRSLIQFPLPLHALDPFPPPLLTFSNVNWLVKSNRHLIGGI